MTELQRVDLGAPPHASEPHTLPTWASISVRLLGLVGVPISGLVFVGTLVAAQSNTGMTALGCLALAPIATAWALVFARLFTLDRSAIRVAAIGNCLALCWAIVVLAARPWLPDAAVWLTVVVFPPALLPFGIEFVLRPVAWSGIDEAMAGVLAVSTALLFVTGLILLYAAWSGGDEARPHSSTA